MKRAVFATLRAVCLLMISTGEKKLLKKNTEQVAGWDFDHDGNLRPAKKTNQGRQQSKE